MSIWNKILVGLVALALLGFFYTGARALRTYEFWGKKRVAFQAALETVERENEALRYADNKLIKLPNGTRGIRYLQSELEQLQANRGRIWEKCSPAVDPQSLNVGLTTVQPNPNGITLKMILYAFEDGDEQHAGQYVGEFKVTQMGDTKVVLKPTSDRSALTDREIRRLVASKGPWTLYELMPADQHELFADMPDDRKKALLPEATVSEYLRDGQAAQPEDPAECKLDIPVLGKDAQGALAQPDGKYHRLLRDYQKIFTACRTDRILFNDAREALTRDSNYLEEAKKDVQVQTQFAQDSFDKLRKLFSNTREQQTAVQGYMSVLQTRFAHYKELLDTVIADNQRKAEQIRQLQSEAARLIEQRSRTIGQLGAGN